MPAWWWVEAACLALLAAGIIKHWRLWDPPRLDTLAEPLWLKAIRRQPEEKQPRTRSAWAELADAEQMRMTKEIYEENRSFARIYASVTITTDGDDL